jgi:hypothetical protein
MSDLQRTVPVHRTPATCRHLPQLIVRQIGQFRSTSRWTSRRSLDFSGMTVIETYERLRENRLLPASVLPR